MIYSGVNDYGNERKRIEWVGLIPDTWSVIPNKYVMHKEKNLCKKWTADEVMSLKQNGVIVRDLQNPTGKNACYI